MLLKRSALFPNAIVFALSFITLVFVSSLSADAQNRRQFCNDYSQNAIEQNELNEERNCEFSGPRWQSNRAPHFAWCMIFPQQAEEEQKVRQRMLRDCRRDARREARQERRRNIQGKRASCDTYAKTAVVHANANAEYECGFRGGEWNRRERPHFRWCMGARRSFLADETRYRLTQLQKCFNKLGDYDEDEQDAGYRRRRQ